MGLDFDGRPRGLAALCKLVESRALPRLLCVFLGVFRAVCAPSVRLRFGSVLDFLEERFDPFALMRTDFGLMTSLACVSAR